MLGSAESQVPKLIIREIIFEEFQRVWSQSTTATLQTDGRTDGRTDGQADGQLIMIDNTALRYASRGKNWKFRNKTVLFQFYSSRLQFALVK